MKKKSLKFKTFICIFIIVIIGLGIAGYNANKNITELKTITSKQQLSKLYEKKSYSELNIWREIILMPFSIFEHNYYSSPTVVYDREIMLDSSSHESNIPTPKNDSATNSSDSTNLVNSSNKDYSTTNIQVENVDEADITKTDGDYIYSISEDNVIITDVKQPKNIKIAAKITPIDTSIPVDLLIYENKLVIISEGVQNGTYNYQINTTNVRIYDISNKEAPKEITNYELYQPYYTSRCINNKLYIISSGRLKKDNNGEIITYYNENNNKKEIGLNNIKYLTDLKTDSQTIIGFSDLNNLENNVKINSYLIDIDNAYISQNNIYLLEENNQNNMYKKSTGEDILKIFGIKGIFGLFEYETKNDYGYYTKIYKFNLLENGEIEYKYQNEIKGKTINQYSIDEYNNNLRIALYTNDGSRIVILNEKLKQIGETPYLAKGEKMYSSRFMGDRAYLVTYKTIDPLYVIDLSNITEPKVLGELKIPGYSTYLHPYDKNHIIGIGMETEEKINRNSQGKVLSTTSSIVGMKMALFDVTDVNNPTQISSVVIGNKRTTSAILTNPKALLFSKEKELIAIPINNYKEDFELSTSTSNSIIVNDYVNSSKNYISEGYAVYKINIEEGLKLKGVINHEKNTNYYSYTSKLLRGLYIKNNLYTISENLIKVNNLDNLELINELKIKGE